MKKNNYAVIMAGGVGSRFWPLSVEEHPKQFIDVLGIGKTLIQLTYERLLKVVPVENVYVITNERYVELINEQLPNMRDSQILTEPERKNTAPCIAYAAAKIYSINSEANLIVAPSDHLILKEERFAKIVEKALNRAEEDSRIITIGIKPSRPDTGYGYIQFYQEGDIVPGQISKVKQFTEKPNRELAEIFVKSGDYYWNSGIFIWKAKTILDALQKFKPDLYHLFCGDFSKYNSPDERTYTQNAFRTCEDISIDFAVMENAKNVDVILADFDWSDLGTWGSLFEHLQKDANENYIRGGKTVVFNSSNCLIHLPKEKEAIIQGLSDYVIVDSMDRLLILHKKEEQKLKHYLKELNQK